MRSTGGHVVDGDLHAFADSLLQADRRTAILTALEADAAEARRVSDWCAQNEAIRRLLGKVLHEPVPVALSLTAVPAQLPATVPETHGTVTARARSAEPRARAEPRRSFGRAWRLRAFVVLASVVALVVASGWTGAQLFASRSGDARALDMVEASDATTGFALRAIETYRTFAPDPQYPVEIPAQQSARLIQWLERRLGEHVVVPQLNGTGYTLLGGRLVPWIARRPAALLIYQNESGQRLALMFAKATIGSELPFQLEVLHGVGAITWIQAGNVVSAAAPTELQRLRSIATIAAAELSGSSAH